MAYGVLRRTHAGTALVALVFSMAYPARPGEILELQETHGKMCSRALVGDRGTGALARLSGRSLSDYGAQNPSNTNEAAVSRCTSADSGLIAVAIRVPADVLRSMRLRCARAWYCRQRPGLRPLWAILKDGWFAACVPVSCLGHDPALRTFAWQLFWLRLAPLRGKHGRMAAKRTPPDMEVRVLRVFGNGHTAQPPVVEALLAQESLDGAGLEGPFDIVTVTDQPDLAESLRISLPPPLKLRFLQPPMPDGQNWKFQWFDVERYLLAYVAYLRRRGLGDRLVIYVDGFDTAWLGCRRNLEKSLEALGRSVFFGVQFGLYPAGMDGYPRASASYEPKGALPLCRERRFPSFRWELEPADEHLPCLAENDVSDVGGQHHSAIYLNGGVYGGRAASLEIVLREFLAKQRLLRRRNKNGNFYRANGKTHQYLWNQYLLDRPEIVALDYGGAFVVNLAPLSVAIRLFGLRPDTGLVHSVLFQKPVCLAHANGGGWADSTLRLLRASSTLLFDTVAFVGIRQELMDDVASMGLTADLDKHDRIVFDRNLCFGHVGSLPSWHGEAQRVELLTPQNMATLQGLQFMVLRAKPGQSKKDGVTFEVIGIQQTPIYSSRLRGAPNATGPLIGRLRLEIAPFHLTVHHGDCIAWRCRSLCYLSHKEFRVQPGSEVYSRKSFKGGSWLLPGRDVEVGMTLHFPDTEWKPRAYAVGIEAEVRGIDFYQGEEPEFRPM